MNRKLKPCPFCGDTAILEIGRPSLYHVLCTNCNARTGDGQMDEAVADWNRRAALTQPQGEVGELVERLEAKAERQREQRGDYFYKGQADPEIEQAARTLTAQAAEIAALRERVAELEAGVQDIQRQAETRIGDGDDMGPRVWRIALADILAEARALLEPEAGK